MLIGIFGGTFDPPHKGHEKYAREFLDKLKLDKLLIIPTCIPPHKESHGACSADRLNMAKLAFGFDERIQVSDIELLRQGKSYTADTVSELKKLFPDDELIFLMGSDMLLCFHKWWKTEIILSNTKICAVSRNKADSVEKLTAYVDEFFPNNKDRFVICEFDPVEISSTQVREAIENNKNTAELLDPAVSEYIKAKELYR